MNDDVIAGLGGAEAYVALQKRLTDLVGLGGRVKISGMLDNLAGHLRALLATSEAERDRSNLHRIVGLAGVLGFSEIDQTWRRVEEGLAGPQDLASARRAAEAAVLFIEEWVR